MKKGAKGRKFHRKRDQRKALMKSLAEALVAHERIETTEAKAKELRPLIEKVVTKSKNNSLHTRRTLARFFSPGATDKLLNDLGPRYKTRPGGYTRIMKRGTRRGDAAKISVIEFVEQENKAE